MRKRMRKQVEHVELLFNPLLFSRVERHTLSRAWPVDRTLLAAFPPKKNMEDGRWKTGVHDVDPSIE